MIKKMKILSFSIVVLFFSSLVPSTKIITQTDETLAQILGKYNDIERGEVTQINTQSNIDTIVLDCKGNTVIPYGNAKILTITDVELNVKMVTLTYKLESEMSEKPALIANYTEGNIACGMRSFHYHGTSVTKYTYAMTENTIKFVPSPQSSVSGIVLLQIFLIGKNDMENPYLAVSNVVSLRIEF